jgi:hypothetical protein
MMADVCVWVSETYKIDPVEFCLKEKNKYTAEQLDDLVKEVLDGRMEEREWHESKGSQRGLTPGTRAPLVPIPASASHSKRENQG